MPARTTIATLSGLTAGIALTLVAVDDVSPGGFGGVLLESAAVFLPLVCVALIGQVALWRWFTSRAERTHQEVSVDLNEQRRVLNEEFTRWSAELDTREERVTQSSENGRKQLLNSAQRLDEALTTLSDERKARTTLQAEFDELAQDYNTVVKELIQDRADTFRWRQSAPRAARTAPLPEARTAGAPAVSVPPHTAPRLGAHTPPAEILCDRMRRLEEPTNHQRPAEGVGDLV